MQRVVILGCTQLHPKLRAAWRVGVLVEHMLMCLDTSPDCTIHRLGLHAASSGNFIRVHPLGCVDQHRIDMLCSSVLFVLMPAGPATTVAATAVPR